VPDTYADVQALIDDVGFKPATPVEEGIKQFVEWYLGYYKA
jgi:UDP-glucuronate 4-epimerase